MKDKYSTDSYDVRGGSKDGNVWCMKLKYDQLKEGCTAKVGFDSEYRHCSNEGSGSYTGVLAYSNSNYIDKSLISSRAVIKK